MEQFTDVHNQKAIENARRLTLKQYGILDVPPQQPFKQELLKSIFKYKKFNINMGAQTEKQTRIHLFYIIDLLQQSYHFKNGIFTNNNFSYIFRNFHKLGSIERSKIHNLLTFQKVFDQNVSLAPYNEAFIALYYMVLTFANQNNRNSATQNQLTLDFDEFLDASLNTLVEAKDYRINIKKYYVFFKLVNFMSNMEVFISKDLKFKDFLSTEVDIEEDGVDIPEPQQVNYRFYPVQKAYNLFSYVTGYGYQAPVVPKPKVVRTDRKDNDAVHVESSNLEMFFIENEVFSKFWFATSKDIIYKQNAQFEFRLLSSMTITKEQIKQFLKDVKNEDLYFVDRLLI